MGLVGAGGGGGGIRGLLEGEGWRWRWRNGVVGWLAGEKGRGGSGG